MLPTPSRNAWLACAASAAVLLVAWVADRAELAVLAGGMMAGLCLAFALTTNAATRLRAARVELAWWLEQSQAGPALSGATFEVRCSLRNRGQTALRLRDVTVAVAAHVEVQPSSVPALDVPARTAAELSLRVRAPAAGRCVLQGVLASAPGPLALFTSPIYFPSPLSIRVLPRAAVRTPALAGSFAVEPVDRANRTAQHLRGAGTELYEIREYQPGDPFSAIAWKPSARSGKLMVREVERETQRTVALVVDASASMRGGVPGERKLDVAIELAARHARAALTRGDRVALRVVDGRTLARVAPGEGLAHAAAVYDALLTATEIVDEDLTAISDEELVKRVARYVRQQDGIELFAGGHARTSALLEHVTRALGPDADRTLPLASSRAFARLRRYCQLRGIALPYRGSPSDDKAEGLASALRAEAGATHAQRTLMLITDLDALPTLEPLTRTVSMLRARGHALSVVVPELGAPAERELSTLERDLWRVLELTQARRTRDAKRAFHRLGVTTTGIRGTSEPRAPRARART